MEPLLGKAETHCANILAVVKFRTTKLLVPFQLEFVRVVTPLFVVSVVLVVLIRKSV
jgi:hypothetical protein